MKRITLLFTLACFCNITFAQSNFISEYFADYEKDLTFNTLNVSSKTFSLFTDIETADVDEQRVLGAIAKLDGVKIINKQKAENSLALYEEAEETIANDDRYEELIRVNTQDENFVFMIREEEEMVKELTIIAGNSKQFLIATLYGEIDLKNISRLTKVIQKQGDKWFEVFENIDSEELVFTGAKIKGKTKAIKESNPNQKIAINVFPNPVSDYVRLEAKDGKNENYTVQFFSIIGEPIKNVGEVNLPFEIRLEDLPSGAYFVRLTNAAGDFKNYRIVKP
ncbi:MAG: hypothetical protein ACI8YQ_001810 [Polaribacter sp.]|jgi:hypothetical protein